ncbi:DUF7344 domain-containing protein [Natronomonas salsuginis]|uniref:DUF7344 domain-containing protein n=1 Tax=Natronomonas salsuginis TaxID=2217661 RepID=UPI001C9E6AB6|nr:hypothetical protein [Natronomonas salsuginis]
MARTVGDESATEDLDEATIHDVLRNDRRRLVIEALQQGDGTATVGDLAEVVAAREVGDDPPPKNKRQSVYVSLHQTHLPKLNSLDIVAYNSDCGHVRLLDRVREVEVYMEVVPAYGLSWGEFYFGWGLLGILAVVAVRIGVPGASAIDSTALAGVFCLGLMAASAYHVYSQQDRILFQRLLDRG